MIIIDKSSYSDSLKWENLAKVFYFDTQVGGGQLSIQNNLTKKTAEFDLNR